MSKRSFPGNFRNYRLKAAGRSDSLAIRKLRCEQLEDRRLLAVVTVNTPNDVIDFNDGRTSLREAIYATNVVPGHDEIIFNFGHDGPQTITLTEGQLEITDSLTITGAGASLFTIDASGNDPTSDEHNGDGSRVFRISSGRGPLIDVSISGVRLTGGDVVGSGGAIESFGALALNNVEVVDNHATFDGGGLSLFVIATLDSTTIRDNDSDRHGGGISVQSRADVTIRNATMVGNTAGISGGGLASFRAASTKIYDSLIEANVAASTGGGIASDANSTTISRTRILSNSANVGAGIHTRMGNLQFEESFLTDNRATQAGGGLRSEASTTMVTRTVFNNNTVTGKGSRGGGIDITRGALSLIDATFNFNAAGSDLQQAGESQGGAISILEADVTIDRSRFLNNSAFGHGGGIWADSSSLRVNDSEFRHNNSTADGGAIKAQKTDMEVNNSRFAFNSAIGRGGAILVDSSTSTLPPPEVSSLRVHNSEFTNNTAGFAGGAIAVLLYENVEIRQSLFRSNKTFSEQFSGGGGGAIYALNTSSVAINESVLQGNGTPGYGGALNLHGSTNIKSSLIRDNRAGLSGGGVAVFVSSGQEVRIDSSSFVENRAGAFGGAIYASSDRAPITVTNSTISQNDARTSGGGIYFSVSGRGQTTDYRIAHSTIAFNRAGQGAAGGGVFVTSRGQVNISHSIIYGNETDVDHQDIAAVGTGAFNIDYALIGGIAPGTLVTANHLLLGVDPRLQPLAPNGAILVLPNQSRLLTHALSPNTPAVDAGDPNLMPGVDGTPEFDQRGALFSRLAAGNIHPSDNPVIDLGAFEVQPARGSLQADFDGDRRVSGHDFLIWQRAFGATNGATYATGDATDNGQVDGNDLAVWKATFGHTVPKTENSPRRVAEQSAAEHVSGALLSAMNLEPNDQQTKRMAPSRNVRLERADARNDVAITHGLDHRQPASYVSNVSNTPASRKAMIDVALEYSEHGETKFSDLVDYIFESHRTTIEKQVV
jgi:predicted outer membrane repeat protein